MPRNQVEEPDDEADLSEELGDGDYWKHGGLPIQDPAQENLSSNDVLFLQHFEQPQDFHGNSQDSHPTEWCGSVFSAGGISTALSLKKMDFRGQMQQGFSLQSSEVMRGRRGKGQEMDLHGGLMVHTTGRKDRHSKVCTARGVTRDRRVRLSPTTAIQFYDVQDRLGYDRPSKAIDWLMKEAKAAIQALDCEAKIQTETERGQVLKSQLEKTGRYEPLNDQKLISRFSFLGGHQAYPGTDFNTEGSIPSTYSSQMWDTNFDLERFQKPVTWNCNSNAHSGEETESLMRNLPLHFSTPPVLSPNHMFFQREPLQSSVIDYPARRPPQLPGMIRYDVHDEFSYFTTEKEHEVDVNPVPSKPFYSATSLHHEG